MEYNFVEIEKKWRKYWADNKTYQAKNDSDKPKYYVLDMFPYPSGAGLHVGHPLGYIASDIVARYKKLKGYNVLHPMGFDAFGLPAEQYAIQTGKHPAETTKENIARYIEQLQNIGFAYDWDRQVNTSDPEYYKWTQWIFLQLFHHWYDRAEKKARAISELTAIFEKQGNEGYHHQMITGNVEGVNQIFSAEEWKNFSEATQQSILMNYRLAYQSFAYVNWCEALGTVLANDEVKDGVSERGGHPVERKQMRQWFLRITEYADRLYSDLDTLEWSDSMKEMQRNWIGRSEGALVTFKIENREEVLEIFTTRPDTIFGVSFMVLAPESELVNVLTTDAQLREVLAYVEKAKNRSERERQADVKNVSGVFTGAYAIHPFTGKQIPIWIGDYVLAGYGTGAVMAVPAHDSRDFRFAKYFGLPIPRVIAGEDGDTSELIEDAYEAKEGSVINSDFLNGLNVKEAIEKAKQKIEELGIGERQVNYRLRDANFSRQRYWGEPFPVYHKDGIATPLDIEKLPLELPKMEDFKPTGNPEGPLAKLTDWKFENHQLETDTMPGFAGSSWYFLRYMDNKNLNEFASKKAMEYWQDVDLYIGGTEHAVGHLLYSRCWHKFLYDLGYVPTTEPFKKLVNQGMILGISAYVYLIFIKPKPDSFRKSNAKSNHITILSKEKYDSLFFSELDRAEKINFVDFYLRNNFTIVDDEINIVKTDEYIELFERIKDSNLDGKRLVNVSKVNSLTNKISYEDFEKDRIQNYGVFGNFEYSYYTEEEGYITLEREVEKMSKSKLNVVNPDQICLDYGADTLRMYEMFLGPIEQSKPWNTNGIEGVHKFLKKLWRTCISQSGDLNLVDETPNPKELKSLHKLIKKIGEDIESLSLNTSIAAFMICLNELSDLNSKNKSIFKEFLILLSPYAPHIADEIYSKMGYTTSIAFEKFPEFNPAFLVEDSFSYPISFNGKMRFNLELPLGLSVDEIQEKVLAEEQTQKWLEGKAIKKAIIVPGRIVNLVV